MSEPSRPELPDAASKKRAAVERSKKYYESNKEHVQEYKRQYHLENRERLVAKSKSWVESNPDKRLAYARQWVKDNAEKNRAYQRKYRLKLKSETFERYGGEICACCSETGIQFLTLDHIDGDGAAHRKSIGSSGGREFYQWLKTNGYPPGYQVLCWNCNSARGSYGYCHNTPPATTRPL